MDRLSENVLSKPFERMRDSVSVIDINGPATDTVTKRAIVSELYFALSKLAAADELLAIVGNWGHTSNDADTLDQLRAYNRNEPR